MPLHMYITSALSIHPSTGTRVVSLSWLLQIMSQCSWEWTFVGTVRSEIHQTEKDKYCMAFLTCVESKKAQLMEIEGRMMATRGRGWGKWEDGSKGTKSDLAGEYVLGIECTALWLELTIWHYKVPSC